MQYWYIACSWVCCCDRRALGLDRLLGGGIRGPKVRDQLVILRYGLLCKQDWPSIWWLGMLGETGRRDVVPIRGSGDFLAYGSPSISASPYC